MTAGGARKNAAAPIDAAEFSRRMTVLGPFETNPEIAVAVSGGPDSLCLAVLVHRWTVERGGKATALIVDHDLRPGSSDEARGVQHQLQAVGMPAEVLPWGGPKPRRNIQALARDARYRLLFDWCRAHGVIHLAVGHHAGDQAETYLLRHRAGSGTDGLAGMAAIAERDNARIIRPLLRLSPERLRATVAEAGLKWIEDPSNADTNYTRTGVRREICASGAAREHCADAEQFAARRRTNERRDAGRLAAAVTLSPLGFAIIDADLMSGMAPDDARRCLSRVVSCIGGQRYPARTKQLESLRLAVFDRTADAGRTLGGCFFQRRDARTLVASREPAAATEVLCATPGVATMWDSRFKVRVDDKTKPGGQFTIRCLDDRAWGVLRRRFPDAAAALITCGGDRLSAPARAALPMLCDLDGPCALPHLPKQSGKPSEGHPRLRISFRPHKPLAGAGFAVDSG